MDSDQFVPIWTIASMEGVKLLTTDMDLILEVLRGKKKTKQKKKTPGHSFRVCSFLTVLFCPSQPLRWCRWMRRVRRYGQTTRDALSSLEKSLRPRLSRWDHAVCSSLEAVYYRDWLLLWLPQWWSVSRLEGSRTIAAVEISLSTSF